MLSVPDGSEPAKDITTRSDGSIDVLHFGYDDEAMARVAAADRAAAAEAEAMAAQLVAAGNTVRRKRRGGTKWKSQRPVSSITDDRLEQDTGACAFVETKNRQMDPNDADYDKKKGDELLDAEEEYEEYTEVEKNAGLNDYAAGVPSNLVPPESKVEPWTWSIPKRFAGIVSEYRYSYHPQQLVKETNEADSLTKFVLNNCGISPSALGYSRFR
ncbi:unnamed protein product [Protopolystoma xenopodis]|uniref:Uncharacterized protein n=1 Tax=Protopolystoma xenopodis TaxID=117903 RepID=A0A448WJ77_9PLAT|nr:unnamed protein product [Protopolystoma xenopodis]